MANLTANYGLKKPLGTEKIEISVLNSNFDVIDSELGKASKKLAHNDYTTLSFTGALGVDAIARIEDTSSCAMCDIVFCRHIQSTYMIAGRVKVQFYPDGETGSVTISDVFGKQISESTHGAFSVVKYTDGKYYLCFDNNYSSLINKLDYSITGFNIVPITPFHISSSAYTSIIRGYVKLT